MTATTDQFAEITARTQEALSTAVRTWADTVQSVAGTFTGAAPTLLDPHAAVDRYFDLAQQVLDHQRRFARTVLTAGTQAAETLAAQAAQAARTARDAGGASTDSAESSTTESSTTGPVPAEPAAEGAPVKVRATRNTADKN